MADIYTIPLNGMTTSSLYFTNATGKLPFEMTQYNGVDEMTKYNSTDPTASDLETVEAFDFASHNTSVASVDGHTPLVNRFISKSIPTTGNSNDIALYENPFKISADILNNVNRYQFVYKNELMSTIHSYENAPSNGNGSGQYSHLVVSMPVTGSLFNPLLAISASGPMDNVPLLNLETNEELYVDVNGFTQTGDNYSTKAEQFHRVKAEDVSDCSIKKLVELSRIDTTGKSSKLGMARYKWTDFMYCKDLGKYSNNMLITLRKFPHPIGDNIFNRLGFGDDNSEELSMSPDIGRMVAWLGNENKLEDIVKFQTKETWKEISAEDEEQQSREDTTKLGALFSIGNPQYMQAFARGTAGSANSILGNFANSSEVFSNKGQYEDNPAMNGSHYDTHKVYTPRGTVQQTHIYEGKLEFTHSFRLVFDYELRAYENINPKAAFLDLLGNVLVTCYRKGTFWGGAHRLIGAPGMGMTNGWKMANDFIENFSGLAGTGGSFLQNLLSGGKNGTNARDSQQQAGEHVDNIKDLAKEAWSALTTGGAINLGSIFENGLEGMLKNGLGRPQVYAFHALLTGEPVGLWHVTIGNPRNPILSMGNLIIESTDYQFYGPLGIDDFPSGLKVIVNLKHAKPRDATEIANMFTKGQTSINYNFIGANSKNNFTNFFDDTGKFDNKTGNWEGSVGDSAKDNWNAQAFGTVDSNKIINAASSVGS